MKILLYDNWKFHLAKDSEPDFAKLSAYEWRNVQIPHDWSTDYPFDKNADTNGSGGYAKAGIGWYWRSFEVKKEKASVHVSVAVHKEAVSCKDSVKLTLTLYAPDGTKVTEAEKFASKDWMAGDMEALYFIICR